VNILSFIILCGKTSNFEKQSHFKFSSSAYTLSKCSYEVLFKRKGKDEFILSMGTNMNSMPNKKLLFQEKNNNQEDLAVSILQISNK